MVKPFSDEHAFVQECNVTSRRYYMCFDIYNSYVRYYH